MEGNTPFFTIAEKNDGPLSGQSGHQAHPHNPPFPTLPANHPFKMSASSTILSPSEIYIAWDELKKICFQSYAMETVARAFISQNGTTILSRNLEEDMEYFNDLLSSDMKYFNRATGKIEDIPWHTAPHDMAFWDGITGTWYD